MKKNVPFLIALLMLLAQFSNAQKTFYVGVHGGLSIPNLTAEPALSNPLNEGYISRVGPHIGVLAEMGLSERFSLQAELNYSGQGGKRNGVQAIPTPSELALLNSSSYTYVDIKNTSRLNYIQLPVMLKFNLKLSEKLKVYISGGGFAALMVAGNQITSGDSYFYSDENGTKLPIPFKTSFDATTDVSDKLHKGNVGVQGSLGISYEMGRGKLFVEGGGNYGFIKLQKDLADAVNRAGAGLLSLGYAYNLKGNK